MKVLLMACCWLAVGWGQRAFSGDPPLCPGAWTLVQMPDTQNYTGVNAPIFTQQMQWIASQAPARNIRFVAQVGDLTNNNTDSQWSFVRSNFDLLNGMVPYALCSGNHDCGPNGSGHTRSTQFALPTRFGAGSPYTQQATFGGYFQHPADPPGNTQNSWHAFRVGRQDYLVLACEWGPRNAVVDWMRGVVASRPHHRVILVCHAYLENSTMRFNWAANQSPMNPHAYGIGSDPDGVNDGREIWDKLAGEFENVCLVCCGHTTRGYRLATSRHGNKVHEMLFDTQSEAYGGTGWLRLLEFYPDGRTVRARTYSPFLNQWDTSASAEFTFMLSPVSSTDTDADGIPDYFEIQCGFNAHSAADTHQDADKDGANNHCEYLAATDPLNAASVLRVKSLSISGANTQLRWQSVPGIRYQTQRASQPGGPWSNVGTEVVGSATSSESTTTLGMQGAKSFYRIAVAEL